jgi:hypothetical protein
MNEKTGRMKDVMYEKFDRREYTLWADAGLKELIKSVEGVLEVADSRHLTTRYSVYIDPRYDAKFVMKEVEAAILCRGNNAETP